MSVNQRRNCDVMTSGRIDNWRSEPGRWSHRIIKSRRKNGESLRRTKSVEEQDKLNNQDKFDVIEEAPEAEASDVRDDGYVEADSIPEEIPIDETQVVHFIGFFRRIFFFWIHFSDFLLLGFWSAFFRFKQYLKRKF